MYRIKLFALLVLFSVALCCGASVYPKSLSTQEGSASTDNLSALQTKDQKGTQDDWNDYVEFYGHSEAYKGVFLFDVSNVSTSVSAYTLNVNFKGPIHSYQVWQWEWYNVASGEYEMAGDNADAKDWKWTSLSFAGTTSFADLVNSNEQVQLQFSSKTAIDDCDIDFLQLEITTDDDSTSEPTSEPTAEPTMEPTSEPTEEPTMEPTSEPTEEPTEMPTSAPTQSAASEDAQGQHNNDPTTKPTKAPKTPTQKPTKKPTTAPTEKPTKAPTQKPTKKPTSAPTEKPTKAPTSAPTEKPTKAPTQKPTKKPTASTGSKSGSSPASTEAPISAGSTGVTTIALGTPPPNSGKFCPPGTHYAPGPQTTWQWQLSGTIDTSVVAQMYDIDMFDSSVSLIEELHGLGRAVTCYIDTAYEPDRPDSSEFPASVKGNAMDGWPGEFWVDIRSPIVRNIMAARISLAASKGCDAVEMDDVDSYENDPGFPLTSADQISFNSFLATIAHNNDLGIALKNDIDQVADLVDDFDFAINEQCFQYDECTVLKDFITQGKAVFGVEYDLSTSQFCSKANADDFSWLKKDLNLDASLTTCCTTCSGTYTCVSGQSTRSVRAVEETNETAEVEYASSAAQLFGFACMALIALFATLL